MKSICNEELFSKLSREYFLLNSKIEGINIEMMNGKLYVIIHFFNPFTSVSRLKLSITEIKEYAFYYQSNTHFYNVETFKLLKYKDMYYFSFDPDEEVMDVPSEHDNDLIIAGKMEGCFQ